MRTVEDAVRLHDALEAGDYKDAVVVGASMVGIKVAELLHKKGIHGDPGPTWPPIYSHWQHIRRYRRL